jgi:AAA+ superfamily predicted ATPase
MLMLVGVGKTATAESVAELTKKPLLSLTCGDLGTTASEVEENLTEYLNLGLKWSAVVLLDEADVFLEQRDLADIKRNALVSVFLRALEYYNGFLFLTTNRVNTFDEAFISRIHVALHYKPLGVKERIQIWRNNIRRLEDRGIKVQRGAKDFVEDRLVDLKWNGREIRNGI